MFSRWAFILIGNNDTGKTSFQKYLVAELCNVHYKRLRRNMVTPVTHRRAPRKWETIFTCNRSYQEKLREYRSVEYYFEHFFQEADICFLSSHSHGDAREHVEQMIRELQRRHYNVASVFWSNAFDEEARMISQLPWQERLWIDNPVVEASAIQGQLCRLAREFTELLIERSRTL
jgi:hypothetical protein